MDQCINIRAIVGFNASATLFSRPQDPSRRSVVESHLE